MMTAIFDVFDCLAKIASVLSKTEDGHGQAECQMEEYWSNQLRGASTKVFQTHLAGIHLNN